MFTIIQIELYKVFKKWRTYIGFLAIGALVIIVETAVYYEGNHFLRNTLRNLQENFILVGNPLNGWFVASMIMNFLWIHIPFLITLVTGDLLAGEGSAGTYRILLTRPISRTQLITAKYITGLIYTFLLVLFLALLSILLGFALFGTGELISIRDKIIIFPENDVPWRFVSAYLVGFIGMTVIASLSFFLSSLVQNSIGPIIGTMAVVIIFIVLGEIRVEAFESIAPYLFTKYLIVWQNFFEDEIDWNYIYKSLTVLIIHSVSLFFITLTLFRKKDILS